jgi:hypothetical protein
MSSRFGGAGCRYPVDDRQCGAKKQPGSSYCPKHHALCHIPRSSPLEHTRLREIDRIGEVVGGRRSPAGEMGANFIRRLENIQGTA